MEGDLRETHLNTQNAALNVDFFLEYILNSPRQMYV